MGANHLISFCGEDMHTEKQESHAVMEGDQALGIFFPTSWWILEGEGGLLCVWGLFRILLVA